MFYEVDGIELDLNEIGGGSADGDVIK